MQGPRISNAPKLRQPVSGIRIIEGPSPASGGMFQLPPKFDRTRYSAQWEEEGPKAEALLQPQHLMGLNLVADGWAIWKDPETGQDRRVTSGSGKKYILLCRPAEIQDEINALYGDKSKADIYKAQTGEVIPNEGGSGAPHGMLTSDMLKGVDGHDEEAPVAPTPNTVQPGGPLSQSTSTKEKPKPK